MIYTSYVCRTCQQAFDLIIDIGDAPTVLAQFTAHLKANPTHEVVQRFIWRDEQPSTTEG